MLPLKIKNQFWGVVEACLIELFKLAPEKVSVLLTDYKASLEELPIGDIFYHSEPYDIACEIANRKSNEDEWQNYLKIIARFAGD